MLLFSPSGEHRFLDVSLQNFFEQSHHNSFSKLWKIEDKWFEPPNYRRQGWSGVHRYELTDKKLPAVFIKRQENHNTRSVLHPFTGIPTYRRELTNIQRFQKCNIPTITPVYYGERIDKGNHQAILITIALDDYQDIDTINRNSNDSHTIPALIALARIVRQMHDHGLAHYCLYPNHCFVRFDGDNVDIRLIDLEKARIDPIASRRRFKDLECFLRHSKCCSIEARKIFLDSYLEGGRLSGADNLRKKLNHLVSVPKEQPQEKD